MSDEVRKYEPILQWGGNSLVENYPKVCVSSNEKAQNVYGCVRYNVRKIVICG
jgi:hypothetical protein